MELLGIRDQVGIIAFDGASYWVSELHNAADKKYILERVGTIEANGGTSIYPALEDAYKALGLGDLAADVAALLGARDPLRRAGPQPADVDLRLRLEALRSGRAPGHEVHRGALARVREEAKHWRRRLGGEDPSASLGERFPHSAG